MAANEEVRGTSVKEDALASADLSPSRPKGLSKVIRLLTVIAYVLSVSLAAIILSIYYIFIWKDRTYAGALRSYNVYVSENVTIYYENTVKATEKVDFEAAFTEKFDHTNLNNEMQVQKQVTPYEMDLSTPSETTEENSTFDRDDERYILKRDNILLKKLRLNKYSFNN